MKILVTGASGLIGRALTKELASTGHTVVRAVRTTPRGDDERQWDPRNSTVAPGFLDGIDAVVHLAGAGIGDKRWSDDYKREILESRTKGTAAIANAIATAGVKPSVFLSGSAIGIYGARGDEVLGEDASHGTGFLADVCEQWEAATEIGRAHV